MQQRVSACWNTLWMLIRRAAYWTSLLALVVAWFTLTSADGTAACRAAAPPPPLNEFGTDGIAFLPPGYECMYIDGRNSVEPLDAAGWVEWDWPSPAHGH